MKIAQFNDVSFSWFHPQLGIAFHIFPFGQKVNENE